MIEDTRVDQVIGLVDEGVRLLDEMLDEVMSDDPPWGMVFSLLVNGRTKLSRVQGLLKAARDE